MTLLYCGIDEAGYGPMLGPLCVAATLFEIDEWQPGDNAPNLWEALEPAVCRAIKGAGKRIPIADSKLLKLPNDGNRDPITHLERGVLTHLQAWSQAPQNDANLFASIGAKLTDEPWYTGDPTPLPRTTTATTIRIDANMLRHAGTRAGVRLVAIECVVLCENEYNSLIQNHKTKAATTAFAARALIARILNRESKGTIRIICDRQGGRQHYGQSVSRIADRGDARVLDEHQRLSRYALDERTTVAFLPEAENAHYPVALASMTAKLVRELAMARFNRYWSARMPGLKPTAGYTTDARRWLADAASVLDTDARARLIRLA